MTPRSLLGTSVPSLETLGAAVPRLPALFAGGLAAFVFLLWALAGGGEFWPGWVWNALLLVVGTLTAWRWAHATPPSPRRAVETQAAISAVVFVFLFFIWALGGGGYFWPVWPLLGLAILLGAHVGIRRLRGDDLSPARERELSQRVETLTRTRRGALDVQSAELRRIERDLHDGAQARLVALSMQLGRAEQGLGDRPEAAELVRAARSEASAAIAELRDLARGIAPPVLADRGLPAAVEALGRRSPVPVALETEMAARRPPAVIETAAYFVVAEALTNVAKHAPEASATVRLEGGDEALRVEVTDDGPGGADPEGGGLAGLRARVEALDGELRISSPRGKGTRIWVELPCGS